MANKKKAKESQTITPQTSAMSLAEIQKKLPITKPEPPKTLKLSVNEFNILIQQQVQLHLSKAQEQEAHQKNIESTQDLEKLHNLLKEYMNSFIVVGYSMNDERVLIQNSNTQKDKDALMELLKNIFLTLQQNNGNMPNTGEEEE